MTVTDFALQLAPMLLIAAGWYYVGRTRGVRQAYREKAQEIYIGETLIGTASSLDLGDSQYWSIRHVAPNHLKLVYEGSDLDYEAANDD